MGELEATLKWFKKYKSPRPDGWPVEFYTAFFELLGEYLLKVIEDCRIIGLMYEAFNTTFIALIPKSDNPGSFKDFCPISLCSCIYKIIAKIIANCLHPILSSHISSEQFSFLQDHQIHEVVGMAQEVLHSVQTMKLKGMILKVDLSKAFDRVSWLYIKILLTHFGVPIEFIQRIMCCILNITFSVLINGSTSHFFHSERGPKQGCPLSTLLFFLIMEGLFKLILEEHMMGRLRGIRIIDNCIMSHLLFVDDVLIFLNGGIGVLIDIQNIITVFRIATGMEINSLNSTLSVSRCTPHEIQFTLHIFPFTLL